MKLRNLSAAFGLGAALACSGGDRDPTFTSAAISGPDTSSLGFVDESASGAPVPARTCGGTLVEPERLPLDMYFLVDSSGSMAEPAGGSNKWDSVTGALVDFLADAQNATINAGIGYFPQDAAPTCTAGQAGCLCIPFINICFSNLGGSCQPADYASPAVPLILPPAPTRLIDDIRAREFAGGTPTRAALEGTYQYLDTWITQNPGRKVVAVLATDGEPAGCPDNEVTKVADVAAAALEGPSRIQTFVIGVGNALANLNQIAQAGGTKQAFLTDVSGDLATEFSAALEAIRGAAGPCVFGIPEGTTGGGAVDPSLVNVRLTPIDEEQPSIIAKTFDGSVGGCDPAGGWHYDDPAAPTRIELCEATCAVAVDARIEVEFGCETVVQSPR
jgi:hypothetical protein